MWPSERKRSRLRGPCAFRGSAAEKNDINTRRAQRVRGLGRLYNSAVGCEDRRRATHECNFVGPRRRRRRRTRFRERHFFCPSAFFRFTTKHSPHHIISPIGYLVVIVVIVASGELEVTRRAAPFAAPFSPEDVAWLGARNEVRSDRRLARRCVATGERREREGDRAFRTRRASLHAAIDRLRTTQNEPAVGSAVGSAIHPTAVMLSLAAWRRADGCIS